MEAACALTGPIPNHVASTSRQRPVSPTQEASSDHPAPRQSHRRTAPQYNRPARAPSPPIQRAARAGQASSPAYPPYSDGIEGKPRHRDPPPASCEPGTGGCASYRRGTRCLSARRRPNLYLLGGSAKHSTSLSCSIGRGVPRHVKPLTDTDAQERKVRPEPGHWLSSAVGPASEAPWPTRPEQQNIETQTFEQLPAVGESARLMVAVRR
jgi:hypothetical protein